MPRYPFYLRKCNPIVPILRDFERRLENLVEGFFATTFRSGLQPVELAKRLLREMDTRKTVGVREVWAPNHFVFSLSPDDGGRFEQAEQALVAELEQVVREAAAERGWGLVGPPEIELEVDRSLSKGKFRCRASLVEGEPEPAPPAAPVEVGEGSLVVLEDGHPGTTFRIRKQSVTVGRLPECDVVVTDPGASRRHARIHTEGGDYILTDLGSTNGTLVNDQPVRERVLVDGDRITIGTTDIEFRRR
ncbi:MAG: DUF3662 and FHA domain-containing protein [Actinomycetota bacterium]